MIEMSVCAGLCNRLRAINAGIRLARESSDSLRIHWERTADMRTYFSELFEPTEEFSIVEKQYSRCSFERVLFSRMNPWFYSYKKGREFAQRCLSPDRPSRLYLATFYDIYHNADYSWLRPIASIRDVIAREKATIGQAIGVHIRRTDHVKCLNNSPIELFERQIEAQLLADRDARFFVATDDPETKERLLNRYGDCIRTRKHVRGRSEDGGVADAVVDLFLLAGAKKIFGSYPSSFSAVASQIGGNPLTYLRIDNPIHDGEYA